MKLSKERVKASCRATWGKSWRELLIHFSDRNIFARQLLAADIADEAELIDKMQRLSSWINSPDRLRADLGADQQGCVVDDNRGGARAS